MDSSISALKAADVSLGVSAHNTANSTTPDFKASRTVLREQASAVGVDVYSSKTDLGTNLVEEAVEQVSTIGYVKANGVVIKTQSQMLGVVINIFG